MRPYLAVFRLALERELVYRANFLFGRLRHVILVTTLLFLATALPNGAGIYDPERLATYFLLGTLLSNGVLRAWGPMHMIAVDIAEGDLTNILLRPIRYIGVIWMRIAAQRTASLTAGILEVGVLLILFRDRGFFFQHDFQALLSFAVLAIGAIVLVDLLSFLGGTLAFFAHRAFGPRYFIYILIELFSGAYIPLDLLPDWARTVVLATPFPSLVYGPVKAYLGDLSSDAFGRTLGIQMAWIAALGCLVLFVWRKGTRSYEAYGR